ncbi:transposase family protein [Gloeothece verrucosa]|uniref:transposase family protein n=1 Tax=Gloeothece verrucosa TaxID=2546359 RepID=UPI0002DE1999
MRNLEVSSRCKTHSRQQKSFYSGKQRCHTLKAQLIINKDTGQIIATDYGKGIRHDFYIFKAGKIPINKEIQVLADKGYQGINKLHQNSLLPHKKPQKSQLSRQQKQENRQQASKRIIVEHIIRHF